VLVCLEPLGKPGDAGGPVSVSRVLPEG
jgi:hypothetical protein